MDVKNLFLVILVLFFIFFDVRFSEHTVSMMLQLEWSHYIDLVQVLILSAISYQAYLIYKQTKADHERSRRTKAVDLLFEWTKLQKENGILARKLVESFDETQTNSLARSETFKIDKKHKTILQQLALGKDCIITEDDDSSDDHSYQITEEMSSKLRWQTVNYLNALETVLISWQYSIADRKIIEDEFLYLFSQNEGYSGLKRFRQALGGSDSYPAIEIFENNIKDMRRRNLKDKAEVDK